LQPIRGIHIVITCSDMGKHIEIGCFIGGQEAESIPLDCDEEEGKRIGTEVVDQRFSADEFWQQAEKKDQESDLNWRLGHVFAEFGSRFIMRQSLILAAFVLCIFRRVCRHTMKPVTLSLVGLLIAGTVKATQDRVVTEDTIGASLFTDAELLTSLANQGDNDAIKELVSEKRCRLITKGTPVSITSQREKFFQVRLKGQSDTLWVLINEVSGWD
jgi:hypothetical protein